MSEERYKRAVFHRSNGATFERDVPHSEGPIITVGSLCDDWFCKKSHPHTYQYDIALGLEPPHFFEQP